MIISYMMGMQHVRWYDDLPLLLHVTTRTNQLYVHYSRFICTWIDL